MKKPRKKFLPYQEEPESDETFQYIAGYTEGGAAFGITWEEARLIEERESANNDKTYTNPSFSINPR